MIYCVVRYSGNTLLLIFSPGLKTRTPQLQHMSMANPAAVKWPSGLHLGVFVFCRSPGLLSFKQRETGDKSLSHDDTSQVGAQWKRATIPLDAYLLKR